MVDLIQYGYDDLDALQNNPANDFFENSAVVARNFACGLYRDYPGWFSGTADLLGASSVFHGFWRGVCKNDPAGLPVPYDPPAGGQCAIRYDIKGQVGAFCPQPEPVTTTFFQNILGPIKGFNVEVTGPRPNPPSQCPVFDIKIRFTDGEGIARGGDFTSQQLSNGSQVPVGAFFAPTGGGGDNCGSSGPTFTPVVPPADRLSPTVTIPVTPTVNINAPINVFVPPIPPAINIRVGELNFNFDLGGLTVNYSPDSSPAPRQPAPTLPRPMPPQESDECPDYSDRFDNIDRDLDALLDCDRCELEKTFQSQQIAAGNSGTANVPENTYAVAVNLTQVPVNARSQSGVNAPRVLYAGWAWFIYNSQLGDRLPIDADGKLFSPENEFAPTGFAYTLYEGFSGAAVARYYTLPQG